MIRNSRAGSSAVFLCVILSALVSICFAFIYSTIQYSTAGRTDALMRLTGISLLSGFDRELLEEYGLFLMPGKDHDLSVDLDHYLTYTFGQERQTSIGSTGVSCGSFMAIDYAPVREQILSFVRSGGAWPHPSAAKDGRDDPAAGKPLLSDTDAGRALRHGPTIASLPSRQLPSQDFLSRIETFAGSLTDVTEVFRDDSEKYLLSTYVLNTFNCTTGSPAPDHFFLREVEYILNGELTDGRNRKKTASDLRVLRLPFNFAHVYADEGKRDALAAAAEALTPGPAAPLTQAALATAWAYAESINDAELLLEGCRVPLNKDASSWAIDLDNVIRGFEPDGESTPAAGDVPGRVIHPEENKGLTYDQYLRVLLFLEDSDLMTARILDLIQINMRKNVNSSFLIGDYCSGIRMDAAVNGRRYSYETLYQRILYD
ncbi:MAG: hypothetical protein IJ128_06490 [Firmicutes bacterium]|nr:hypothetical protein [Bacillota bacterium]